MLKVSLFVLFFVLFLWEINSKSIDGLKVSGNYIVNSKNQLVKLRGVTRSGSEYACKIKKIKFKNVFIKFNLFSSFFCVFYHI